MAELLVTIAADLTVKLDAALPLRQTSDKKMLLNEVLAVVRSPVVAAYIRLWREVVATAALGEQAHREMAAGIIEGYVAWLADRMPAGRGRAPVAGRMTHLSRTGKELR